MRTGGYLTKSMALAASILLASTAIAEPPSDPATADFIARMKATPLGAVGTPDVYTPVERVKGRPGKAFRNGRGITAAALASAQAYADAQQSYAFVVARNGAIVHERYAPGFSPASRYATASMHKAVLALAFGSAIEKGLIGLQDPLARHLPELANDPIGGVTIEQALRMTGGIGSPPAEADSAVSPAMALLYGTDSRKAIRRFGVVLPPGTEFAYQNISTQLAGLALQAAIGERYADFLSRTLWAPIGAGDAALWLDRPDGNPHLFCCLQATARDWLRVGELVRNEGKVDGRQVVRADWVRAVTAPSPLNPNFGMNFWRGSPHLPVRRYAPSVAMTVASAEPFARDDVVFIDGAGGQRVYIVPSAGLTIVRIGKPSADWDDSLLVNRVLAGLAKK
jgi:CubicO group peptidase (beta-lactamase class C family)